MKIIKDIRNRKISFKEIINSFLRSTLDTHDNKVRPFKVKSKNLKARIFVNLDNIGELLEYIEGSSHK